MSSVTCTSLRATGALGATYNWYMAYFFHSFITHPFTYSGHFYSFDSFVFLFVAFYSYIKYYSVSIIASEHSDASKSD